MVMLDVFNRLKNELQLQLYVLHYNHKWRKKSYLDLELVKKYCLENNIRFLCKESKGKIVQNEEIASEQRYLFFRDAFQQYDLKYIFTAHHKDDQFETVLFRLVRGTGPNGLLPIKQILLSYENTSFYRPFLKFTKEEIKNYAKENKIKYCNDITNLELKYKRNLIRLKIVPLLKKINSEAMNNVLACSKLAYSQSLVLDKYFSSLLKKLVVGRVRKENIAIDRKEFFKLEPYTQIAFFYWLLSWLGIKGSVSKIELFKELINNTGRVDLSSGYLLIVTNSLISIGKEKLNLEVLSNGKKAETIIFRLNSKDKKIVLNDKEVFALKKFKDKLFRRVFPSDKEKTAYVDLGRYKDKLLMLRYREQQDVFQPLGYTSTTKLKNYLINKKIPSSKRYNLPLLCFGKEVLWLPGYALSEKLRVNKKPTHVLRIGDCSE